MCEPAEADISAGDAHNPFGARRRNFTLRLSFARDFLSFYAKFYIEEVVLRVLEAFYEPPIQ